MMITDIMWTKYTISVASRAPVSAGIYSAMIIIMGAVTVVSYTEDHTMVIPAALGAFVGTYLAVKREKIAHEEE
jgi:hypothetical protein